MKRLAGRRNKRGRGSGRERGKKRGGATSAPFLFFNSPHRLPRRLVASAGPSFPAAPSFVSPSLLRALSAALALQASHALLAPLEFFFFFLTKEVESVESGEFAFFFPSHRSSSREKGEKSDAMNPEHARNPSLFFLHASLGGEHM